MTPESTSLFPWYHWKNTIYEKQYIKGVLMCPWLNVEQNLKIIHSLAIATYLAHCLQPPAETCA